MQPLSNRIERAYQSCAKDLLSLRNEKGYWTGELSTSCLSTATATSALALYLKNFPQNSPWDRATLRKYIQGGASFLVNNIQQDGGWGDTDKSFSNVATTFLGWASLCLAKEVLAPDKEEESSQKDDGANELTADREQCQQLFTGIDSVLPRVRERIESFGGVDALKKRYGRDKTFVVPILTNCALAGLADWKDFSALPFEMSILPQKMYRFFNMAVVSYAIPALVAIGQAHYYHKKPIFPLNLVRSAAIGPSMKVLLGMQPESGGFLEAAPLTSFVGMSLAATGRAEHDVTKNCIRFLIEGVLPDGSWPIDTNLATWVTTQSAVALSSIGDQTALASEAAEDGCHEGGGTIDVGSDVPSVANLSPQCWDWIQKCQYTAPHPATGADPGGWGWTDLSGSVPDADDTPGALLALFSARKLTEQGKLRLDLQEIDRQAEHGVRWLAGLQNRDGGWPTFCKGWGRLPFDKSGSDLTAHALRAINTWWPYLRDEFKQKLFPFAKGPRTARRLEEAVSYLVRSQRADGSWLPLWFGNQDQPDDENPFYGTSKSLMCLVQFYSSVASDGQFAETNRRFLSSQLSAPRTSIIKGVQWLLDNQNSDGGWGGGESLRRYRSEHFAGGQAEPGCGAKASDGGNGVFADVSSETDSNTGAGDRLPEKNGEDWFSSIEETALVVDLLALVEDVLSQRSEAEFGYWQKDGKTEAGWDRKRFLACLEKGQQWLCRRVECGEHTLCWPIGFYFAKLWYHERLYPLIFATSALGRSLKVLKQAGDRQLG